MKRILIVLGMLAVLLVLLPDHSYASILTQDSTGAEDLVFTEITADSSSVPDSVSAVAPIPSPESSVAAAAEKNSPKEAGSVAPEAGKTLWKTFLEGLAGGFLAFLMPCIFPMVPLTISYFTKRAGSKSKGAGQALIYGLSIIVIYVAFGLLITVIFGSAGLNEFSSSGIFNFFFFLLLVVFAVSFFGAFEITLPSSLVNRIDNKADNSKGLGGIFFMAASLALVSFSCTGPII
ncbi:MAG TPA: cytochrome c biogenesis protein CcdA, partial [Pedobacter sp.]|nr:cytochrome c biogenesis protein CcdA [Pedobacter sp.]